MAVAEVDELTARAIAARDGDQRTYAKAVHRREYEPYQDAWAEALETGNRVAIVCPPSSYKTTTVRDFVEREIGRNPNVRILWLMNAGAQSTKQVMSIAQTIKYNPAYRTAFHIQEDPEAQWTKEVLYVERSSEHPDPTLMGTGLNGPYQGLHFDIIIIDDPTDQEDVRSPTTMELQRNKIQGVVIDRLVEDGTGRIVAILTRWGQADLLPTLESMGFTVYEMPIVGDYPWGPTLSPARFPHSRIEQIRRDKGDILFSLTYMCNPMAVQGTVILREHMQYWDESLLPSHPMQFVMALDPATSTRDSADYSAIATVGVDLHTRIKYLVDMWAGRVETPDLEHQFVTRASRTAGLRAVGLETAGFQVSLLQTWRRKYQLPFREIPYRSRRAVAAKVLGIDRDKTGRALYLDAELASGRLLLPRYLPLVDGVSLEEELLSFSPLNTHRHDDRMDALAMASVLADTLARPPTVEVSLRGF